MQKSVCMRVDFPLPVLPTIPVFIPPRKVHERPRNTSGMCGAYRTYIHAQYQITPIIMELVTMMSVFGSWIRGGKLGGDME